MATVHASFDRWWNGISLRAKITGVTVLLLTFGLVVAGAGTMTVLRNYLFDQVDAKVDSLRTSALQLLSTSPDTIEKCKLDYHPYGQLFAVLSANGGQLCSNVPGGAAEPALKQFTLARVLNMGADKVTISAPHNKGEWRVRTILITPSDGTDFYTIVVGQDLQDTESTIARYVLIFFGFALAVIIFGAATTQLLVTSTFAPLREVEATAARFAAGDYSQRLGGATPNTEVGRLNRSLNAMLARIDRAFADRQRTVEQMRRFVGDASHELRTPLVSLRGYAELYRMGALQNPEDVAQAMDRIEREAIRMGGLVEDLLQLARLDEAKPLDLAPVDLLPIAQDAALDASASAPQRTVTVVVPQPIETDADAVASPDDRNAPAAPVPAATGAIAFAGATLARLRRRRARGEAAAPAVPAIPAPLPEVGPIVLAEENKVRQVVTNLMGNAMRFTPDDSPIELVVEVDRAAGFGQLSVVDHGEGIPPQLREKIFQRFFRADTSRTRDTGGSGLGLAIVAGIVANHGGLVEVLETPGGGATFRVSLPLLPSPEATPSPTGDGPGAPEAPARS